MERFLPITAKIQPYSVQSAKRSRPLAPQALEPVASRDSLDWKDISAAEITQRVTSKVQCGSIVLFHNAALHTPEALPGIIETLLQEGYTFVPVSQLILSGEYTIDHTGRQCPA
jgi:peptidoglycan/xylan/chitin deacetylase (PgdA/CDA1 family)